MVGVFLAVLREKVSIRNSHRGYLLCGAGAQLHPRSCCQKYFDLEPMILRPGLKTVEDCIKTYEVGSDRIADAMGAIKLSNRNLVGGFRYRDDSVRDYKDRVFLGGNIMPGIRLAMEALEAKTAKLPSVEIKPTRTAIGKTTTGVFKAASIGATSAWSGNWWRVSAQSFADDPPLVIATGGFANLFHREDLFDRVVSDLILVGLIEALRLNGYLDAEPT